MKLPEMGDTKAERLTLNICTSCGAEIGVADGFCSYGCPQDSEPVESRARFLTVEFEMRETVLFVYETTVFPEPQKSVNT